MIKRNIVEMACPAEQAIVDYVEHLLDEAGRAEIDAHLDGCPRCQTAAAELASALGADEPISPRSYAGRYVVQRVLGAGGMGVVYAAHDRELDRIVALKVLRRAKVSDLERTTPLSLVTPEANDAAITRARREARALARLQHDNVVEVYDVGPCDEGLFIAMELVEGATLRQWLAASTPTWSEIVAVFLGAAEALAAAHACALVHRDFKPDNVIVAAGRAKVLDFGLARGYEVEGETVAGVIPDGSLDGQVTQTGTILGTPRYLAPELHAGAPADARSDQYAFFVALHEALGRARPFRARSLSELHREKARPPAMTGSAWSEVPGWLRRVVRRGTDPDPAARFDSMAQVVEQLRRGRRRAGWRPIAAAVGVLGVVGAVVGSWFGYGSSAAEGCAAPTRTLDHVWSPSRRMRVARAIDPQGTKTDAVAPVDAWAREYAEAYTAACQADAGEMRDAMLGCLGEGRVAIDALLTRIEAGKTTEIRLDGVVDPSACEQLVADRGGEAAPRFQSLRETVARGLALANASAPSEALELLLPAIEQARASEATWIEARALMAAGMAYGNLDDLPAAKRTLLSAYEVARSHGHDSIQAAVATSLASIAASHDRDVAAASSWARHAEAALRRVGRDPAADHALQVALGKTHQMEGDLQAAAASFTHAMESAPNPSQLATATLNLSMIRLFEERFDEAQRLQRQAVDLFREAEGEAAPRTLGAMLSLAASLIEDDRLEAAQVVLDEVLETIDASPDPVPMLEARARQAQGVLAAQRQRWPRAIEMFEASLRITEKVYGVGHVSTTPDMLNLARVYLALGNCDAADVEVARAQTIIDVHPDTDGKRAHVDTFVERVRDCRTATPDQGQTP